VSPHVTQLHPAVSFTKNAFRSERQNNGRPSEKKAQEKIHALVKLVKKKLPGANHDGSSYPEVEVEAYRGAPQERCRLT
jgi:hypothetical protein